MWVCTAAWRRSERPDARFISADLLQDET